MNAPAKHCDRPANWKTLRPRTSRLQTEVHIKVFPRARITNPDKRRQAPAQDAGLDGAGFWPAPQRATWQKTTGLESISLGQRKERAGAWSGQGVSQRKRGPIEGARYWAGEEMEAAWQFVSQRELFDSRRRSQPVEKRLRQMRVKEETDNIIQMMDMALKTIRVIWSRHSVWTYAFVCASRKPMKCVYFGQNDSDWIPGQPMKRELTGVKIRVEF